LTSTKIGEVLVNPSERKEDDNDIVLSDKQGTTFIEVYYRMPNEAGHLVAEGLHHDAFNAVHWEICFEQLRERIF
jgi:hypothetical protein